ncbi:unnamed protein product [Ranitomeya imitator]|uniref:Uncharacterized protein n=1 Tax=Ranitomeya imitator TaxID=111125 RepID=A0ABN9MTA7_9NEOB|nr:unnamed protein product [Ranitomeya imitator]
MGASGHSREVFSQPEEVQTPVKSDFVNSPQKLPKDEMQSSKKTQKGINPDDSAPQPQLSSSVSPANFRPFNKEVGNFKYVKGHVLPPESGVEDMITPCHEYKSLITASKLDRTRLQDEICLRGDQIRLCLYERED